MENENRIIQRIGHRRSANGGSIRNRVAIYDLSPLAPLFFEPGYAHDRLFGPNCSNRIEIQGIVVKGTTSYQRHLPHSPSMHGHIPRPPEDVDVVRVPPIAIEISIGEMQQFTDQIQKRVEHQVEET